MSLPKIIDNNRRVLKDTLDQLCENYDEISIATGYWDLPGTQLLIDKLESFKKIRILIGQEPLAPRYKKSNPEIDFPDQDIFSDLEMLEQTSSYKDLIVRIRTLIEEDKLEVKIYKKTFFHAKAYIFGNYGSDENVAIIGSSNFTRAGLTGNTELNSVEADGRIITSMPKTETQEIGHLFWFDQFWNEAEEWTGEFSRLLSTSTVGDQMFSPYEMYIATLYQIYKEEL
ncbi:MAG: phospholipase D-like domain-containing protein, partial [Candidatus Saccharimonadales bacterium]